MVACKNKITVVKLNDGYYRILLNKIHNNQQIFINMI